MTSSSPDFKRRVDRLLGWATEQWQPMPRGYTAAARYVVRDGTRSAFVKIGTTPLTVRLLRSEKVVYDRLPGPFMPELIGWQDDESQPILIIEDLSHAHWPPPWRPGDVERVLEQIRAMHASRADLERRTLLYGGREAGWPTVADDPAPLLSLGLVSARWLEEALPVLIAAEAACELDGDAVTHLDLRSDNICLADGMVKFIDWAEAGIGNADVDLGFWLPSLAFEGGPLPEAILPNAPAIAALVSGFFAARAGLPVIPDAPFVRRVQREQLSTALPWAQRALGLPAF
jgi:hypothetical protein